MARRAPLMCCSRARPNRAGPLPLLGRRGRCQGGNQAREAAQILGLSESNLWRLPEPAGQPCNPEPQQRSTRRSSLHEPVAAVVAAGRLDGGGPGVAGVVIAAGEPCDIDGERQDGGGQDRPSPRIWVREVPLAATAEVRSRRLAVSWASRRRRSSSRWAAIRYRAASTALAGSSSSIRWAACAAVNDRFAPPSRRARRSACSQLTTRVRCPLRSSRYSISSRNTAA
jgi:hypothetical protein